MTDPGSFARDAAEADATRRERERLLTALSDELAQASPSLPASVLIDNLWGWVMWEKGRGRV